MKILSKSSRVGEEVNGMEEKKGLLAITDDVKDKTIGYIDFGPALEHLTREEAFKELAKNKEYIQKMDEGRII